MLYGSEVGQAQRLEDPYDRRRVLVAASHRYEEELLRHSRGWRQRLQNHASEAGSAWPTVLEHVDALGSIARRSAIAMQEATAER